ncbi:lactonase family protein [Paenibacillus spiritus]|uniref:Lactonase family protein n=1 Tax=Paenibacillus spiritus TaxID=2496557 RepID=A0A5J5G2R2_9BACL|nr:lactonase family protein [Paenibacillus spiritus]KAA9000991.1 lactonase family protein [Paenibacillus spiritus]
MIEPLEPSGLEPEEVLFVAGTYGSGEQPTIYIGALDTREGTMRIVGSEAGIENPSFLALSDDLTRLYAASEKEEGEVAAYALDLKERRLTALGAQKTEGAAPCYAALDSSGNYLYAVNYGGGNVNVFPVGTGGGLGGMTSQARHSGAGVREDRQDAPHPHSVTPVPGGERVLVCDLGLDVIRIYRLEDGQLRQERDVRMLPGSGPRHLALHPNGRTVYCANELNCTVSVLEAREQYAELEPVQHVSTLPEAYAPGSDDSAADVHLSPDGRYLYVSNRGHDSIVRFPVDETTGRLKEEGDWQSTGGKTPRNFAVAEGWVLAANQTSGNITSFRLNPEDGRLIPTGSELELPSPVCVLFLK